MPLATETHRRLGSALSSYSLFLSSNFGPTSNRLYWQICWVAFLSPNREMLGQYFKLGHYRLIPYSFKFIIHWASQYWTLTASVFKPQFEANFVKISVCSLKVKVKLKCTPVQALRLCTGRTAHGGRRGMTLLFLDHGTRRGWGVSVTRRLLFTPGKDLVPILQEARWAPGPVWTGAKNLASHQDSIPGPSSP